MIKAICEYCGKEYHPKRIDNVTCGDEKCRKAYQRAYKKAYQQTDKYKAYQRAYNKSYQQRKKKEMEK